MAGLGQALLAAGCVAALVAVLRGSRALLVASGAALGGATAILAWALVTSDFSFEYVAETSRRGASAWYRFAALWGGSAGSLLVLALVVAVVAAVAAGRWTTSGERRVLAVPVALLAGATLFVADPFAAIALTPIDGVGLTPILEHPAMAIHPPLLYVGLAATLPPYAAAVSGRAERAAGERARRWLLMSVGALTLAMALGAVWSYVEAGWGGYWAWDPVENTSLAVWLAGLVALHRGVAGQPRPAALPAVLAAAGTALTRSGVASSVHSFAEDAALGWTLAGLAVLALAGAFVAWRRSAADRSARAAAERSGDGRASPAKHAATAAALLGLAVAVVAVGSAAPALRRLAGDPGTAVGGWFFSRIVGAVAVVALVVLLLAAPVRARTRAAGVVLGAAAAVAALAAGWGVAAAVLSGLSVAVAVSSAATVAHGRGPMWLAHLGIAVLLVGVAGTTATEARTVALQVGGSEQVGAVVVTNAGVSVERGTHVADETGNGRRVVTRLRLDDGGTVRSTSAALVAYPALGGVLAETALWSRPWRDVQVTLVRADDAGRAVVEVRVRPLAQLVWWGAVLTTAGVALSGWWVSDRRRDASSAGPSAPGASARGASRSSSAANPATVPVLREPVVPASAVPASAVPEGEASEGAAEPGTVGLTHRRSDHVPGATAVQPAPGGRAGRVRSTPRPASAGGG